MAGCGSLSIQDESELRSTKGNEAKSNAKFKTGHRLVELSEGSKICHFLDRGQRFRK